MVRVHQEQEYYKKYKFKINNKFFSCVFPVYLFLKCLELMGKMTTRLFKALVMVREMKILGSLEICLLLKVWLLKRMLLKVEACALSVCKFQLTFLENNLFNMLFLAREKYKNPRVLSCLHVLCENCLKDLLAVDDEDGCENVIYSGRSKPHRAFISCPLCKQETAVRILSFTLYECTLSIYCFQVGDRGLSSLHLDPVYQKKTASDSCLSGLICTSCKANEEAVAKCMDCDNLLCPNCYSAHKVPIYTFVHVC